VFDEISQQDVGTEYQGLLRAFVDLESRYRFEKGKKNLPAAGRPTQLSEWIRDGRGRSKTSMVIDNLAQYEEGWWKWWLGMQPSWQVGEDGVPVRPEEYRDDWGGLVAPGQNGLLSVVATLYWWAQAEVAQGINQSAGWREAVADTLWVLKELAKESPVIG
jgi:hypothetical protein